MNFDPATIFEILLTAGVFTVITEIVRKILGRGRAKIDAAVVIQGAALDLIEPLRKELEEARTECRDMRTEIEAMRQQVDRANNNARAANQELGEARVEIATIRGWAQDLKRALEENNLPVPPVPIRRVQ